MAFFRFDREVQRLLIVAGLASSACLQSHAGIDDNDDRDDGASAYDDAAGGTDADADAPPEAAAEDAAGEDAAPPPGQMWCRDMSPEQIVVDGLTAGPTSLLVRLGFEPGPPWLGFWPEVSELTVTTDFVEVIDVATDGPIGSFRLVRSPTEPDGHGISVDVDWRLSCLADDGTRTTTVVSRRYCLSYVTEADGSVSWTFEGLDWGSECFVTCICHGPALPQSYDLQGDGPGEFTVLLRGVPTAGGYVDLTADVPDGEGPFDLRWSATAGDISPLDGGRRALWRPPPGRAAIAQVVVCNDRGVCVQTHRVGP